MIAKDCGRESEISHILSVSLYIYIYIYIYGVEGELVS